MPHLPPMPIFDESPNPDCRQHRKQHGRRPVRNHNQPMIGRIPISRRITQKSERMKPPIPLPDMPQMPLNLHRISRHPPIPDRIRRKPVLLVRKTSRRLSIQIADDVHPPADRLNQPPVSIGRNIAHDVAKPETANPHRQRRQQEQQRHATDERKHNATHDCPSYPANRETFAA